MSSGNAGSDNPGSGAGQLLFQPNEEAVAQIMSLGFSRNAAIRALFYTGNQTADQAADWLLENNDKNLDTPLETDLQGTSDSSDEDEFLTTDTFKMVFVVNMELQMGVGKVAAQVAHAALSLFRSMMEDEVKAEMIMAWGHLGETKVVVRGDSTTQLEMLAVQAAGLQVDHYLVQDAGLTQVTPGSKTVLAVFGKVDDVNRVTGSLKLL
ncbi:probable peptidyl-tRNA hydrolase 2 [Aplysia californica]|uniref:peptidyl-tRNA hydrolase n=1 Tax=Aplysia californica TaxID=6500 RepID=A0ABM0JRW1_APLCA|nr:probable peptidyl-tRNA hydrolase 2 [Aplysia californica]XP_005100113.1 probable peptidyl-tRNA hydrolase 2 [Aplysia californica]